MALASTPITPAVPWTVQITVPVDTDPGEITVGKQCHRVDDEGEFDGGEATERLPFEVTAPVEPITTDPTPDTTLETTPLNRG